MEDPKSVTVATLRQLARKHLGPGHSKLKKAELIAALVAAVPALAKLPGLVTPAARKPAGRGAAAATGAAPRRGRAAEPTPAAKVAKPAKAAAGATARAARAAAKQAPVKADAAPATGRTRRTGPAAKAAPEEAGKAPAARAAPKKRSGSRSSARAPVQEAAATPPPAPAASPPSSSVLRAEVISFPARPRPRSRPEVEAADQASAVEPPAGERLDAASIPAPATPPSAESSAPADTGPSQPLAPPDAARAPAPEELHAMEQHEAEPLVEGFFVARVAGEKEARLHHLTHDAPPPPPAPRDLLASAYGDDTAIALPRDPYTLFVFWDFSPATRERALQGLSEPRAMLRVFDGEGLMREQDFALESSSFYVHGLPPGRTYRVEFHFVGRDGRSRRIGHSTNRVQLPPAGPSSDTSVRFMRVPNAAVPRTGVLEPQPAALPPAARVHEYLTWRRVPLPGSGGFEDVVEVRRESELEAPAAFSPPGPPTYLETPARSEGSSEQTAWSPSPSGRGR